MIVCDVVGYVTIAATENMVEDAGIFGASDPFDSRYINSSNYYALYKGGMYVVRDDTIILPEKEDLTRVSGDRGVLDFIRRKGLLVASVFQQYLPDALEERMCKSFGCRRLNVENKGTYFSNFYEDVQPVSSSLNSYYNDSVILVSAIISVATVRKDKEVDGHYAGAYPGLTIENLRLHLFTPFIADHAGFEMMFRRVFVMGNSAFSTVGSSIYNLKGGIDDSIQCFECVLGNKDNVSRNYAVEFFSHVGHSFDLRIVSELQNYKVLNSVGNGGYLSGYVIFVLPNVEKLRFSVGITGIVNKANPSVNCSDGVNKLQICEYYSRLLQSNYSMIGGVFLNISVGTTLAIERRIATLGAAFGIDVGGGMRSHHRNLFEGIENFSELFFVLYESIGYRNLDVEFNPAQYDAEVDEQFSVTVPSSSGLTTYGYPSYILPYKVDNDDIGNSNPSEDKIKSYQLYGELAKGECNSEDLWIRGKTASLPLMSGDSKVNTGEYVIRVIRNCVSMSRQLGKRVANSRVPDGHIHFRMHISPAVDLLVTNKKLADVKFIAPININYFLSVYMPTSEFSLDASNTFSPFKSVSVIKEKLKDMLSFRLAQKFIIHRFYAGGVVGVRGSVRIIDNNLIGSGGFNWSMSGSSTYSLNLKAAAPGASIADERKIPTLVVNVPRSIRVGGLL